MYYKRLNGSGTVHLPKYYRKVLGVREDDMLIVKMGKGSIIIESALKGKSCSDLLKTPVIAPQKSFDFLRQPQDTEQTTEQEENTQIQED